MTVQPESQTPAPAVPFFEDFTVTSIGPLRIRRDGDTSPLSFTPDSLIDEAYLQPDDRVRVELAPGRLIVHGRAGGPPPPTIPASLPLGATIIWPLPKADLDADWLVLDGSAIDAEEYPWAAAQFGANMPDRRLFVPVGYKAGDADFGTLNGTTGSKTHNHTLADTAFAYIYIAGTSGSGIRSRRMTTPSWTNTWESTDVTGEEDGRSASVGTPLGGATDAGSSIQPSWAVNFAMKVR